jgi:hypothetical protein
MNQTLNITLIPKHQLSKLHYFLGMHAEGLLFLDRVGLTDAGDLIVYYIIDGVQKVEVFSYAAEV